jgi:hypothetical protein
MSRPAVSPSDAEVTGGLVHGLLHALCLGSAAKEAAARGQIRDHLQHPSLGPDRGAALFTCATMYTAHNLGLSLSRLKIQPGCWEFQGSGDTYHEDEAGHEQAKAAAVALLQHGHGGGPARDVIAPQLSPLQQGPAGTPEAVAAAESLIVEAVWLSVLASSSSSIARKQ